MIYFSNPIYNTISNFAYLADSKIENFDTVVEGMADKTAVDYLNLDSNLKSVDCDNEFAKAVTVYTDKFIKDGKQLSVNEKAKLDLLLNNVNVCSGTKREVLMMRNPKLI